METFKIKQKLRPELEWFADKMEDTLKNNDHKGGWERCSLQYLSMRLTQERKELAAAIKSGDKEAIIKECTDVANFAMMIASNQTLTP